jgi:membrane-associated phospholipid phosphatase
MTTYAEWLAVQNGAAAGPTALDPLPRHIRNGRDLGEYVHRDFTYQAFLNAALILLSMPGVSDPGNPYLESITQGGFLTFGRAHVLDLVAKAARCALMAAWCQKWQVHRRLRPEAYGGLVHHHLAHTAAYPFLHADVLDSGAVAEVVARFGTSLLPMAYPEGCPTHPAYPAGHAAIAGACATVLKAFFHEGAVLPRPVEASTDGLTLHPYAGPALTVGNELNKLAANIAIGRDTAGVHWRSDAIEGLRLGEAIAIGLLTDLGMTYHESFGGWSLTTFDGATITI